MATQLTIRGARVKRRHALGPLGLTIVTFGIYGVFWWYFINREMRDLGEDVDPILSVLAITVGWLVIIPPFVSVFRTAERVQHIQESAAVGVTDSALERMMPWLALILWVILPYLFQPYMQWSLNTAYDTWVEDGSAIALEV